MHYIWVPIILLFILAAISGVSTSARSPFQTEQVKEIWLNMTKAERSAANKRSVKLGLLSGTILAVIPSAIGFILGLVFLHSALKGLILGILLIFPVAAFILWKKFFPYLNKSWRLFFASTQWAKNQGIKADDIRLFNWEK